MEIKISQLKDSNIEVVFEIPTQDWAHHIKSTKTLAEASEALIKESWLRAVKENSIEPIGPARTRVIEIVPGKPARFKVEVSVLPETKLPEYASIVKSIERKEIEVSESDVEEALKSWQMSQAKFKALDHPAKPGDFVEIEFSSSLFSGQPDQRDGFRLGQGRLIPGFEEELAGLKAGQEKRFKLTYPDPYFASHLAGQESEFKVKMIRVAEVETEDLVELARRLKMAESLDELKQKVRADLAVQARRLNVQRWRQEVISKVAEQTEVVSPDTLIEYEQLRLIEGLKRQVQERMQIAFPEYLKRLNQSEEGLKQTYRHEAERNVRHFLVVRALAKVEQIDISEEELTRETERVKTGLDEKQMAPVDQAQLRAYTKDALTRDKLFAKLSSLK